jgi:putative heme transporter
LRTRSVRVTAAILSLATAGWLLAVVIPHVAGVGWSAIGSQLAAVDSGTLLGLAAVWLAGQWSYAYVQAVSLPGLTKTQAMALTWAGSAVSNVLPFGAAAGVALTFAMAGSWGHSRRAIAVSTVVTGVWNVLSRLCLPAVGLVALVVAGDVPHRRFTAAAVAATAALVVSTIVLAAVIAGRWPAGWTHPVAGRVLRRLPAAIRAASQRVGRAARRLRHDTVGIVAGAWLPLTLGMAGYLTLQAALFWACLAATGVELAIGATLAAFALSRLLAAVPLTPGGVGISESATVVLLVGIGASPAPAAAAVLLFAVFSYAIEIPAGGVAVLAWLTVKRWRRRPPRESASKAIDVGRCSAVTRE